MKLIKLPYITAILLSLSLFACNGSDEPDIPEPTPDPVPVTSVELDTTDVTIAAGDTIRLTATVLPADADNPQVTWTSGDESIATVSPAGLVTAVAAGQTTVTATADGMYAVATVTVYQPAQIGDYLYADGTWSTDLDTSKKAVAIVFYTGNPTLEDPTLAAEHPECFHGLAVSLSGDDSYSVMWQAKRVTYGSTVGAWITANTDFVTTLSDAALSAPVNRILGYNNTRAIQAFNQANPTVPVGALEAVEQYAAYAPVTNCSGWYLPSAKELALLVGADLKDGVVNSEANTAFVTALNDRMATLPGSSDIDGYLDYLSSTEMSVSDVYSLSFDMIDSFGCSKTMGANVRVILAF